ncbi:toxin subunit [Fusarium napiforme]|uniref:Toxin subunit n=1 Tax=Fusarium napiforme TaxID=42672 RepID=A0A8H5IHI2_9HYPO|nr:toxin subunit [Fusarium napiforme]
MTNILSAYLVELLRFLQVSPCLPKPPAQYGSRDKQVPSSSLFERLLSRRPDDQKIELSHENDSVRVDYIDLANEVVKSLIFYLQEIPVHFSQFLDRAEVAEMLNLSQEDFLAITTESFWSSPIAGFLFGMSLASYVENQHLKILASEAVIDDMSGVGLAFIKQQPLPRFGFIFDDLIALLRAQYIVHRLTIVPMTQVGKDFDLSRVTFPTCNGASQSSCVRRVM